MNSMSISSFTFIPDAYTCFMKPNIEYNVLMENSRLVKRFSKSKRIATYRKDGLTINCHFTTKFTC